jgi:hypothetical protein
LLVNTEIAAENAARSSVGKILDADTIQAVVILLGTRAVDRYLILKPAIAAV